MSDWNKVKNYGDGTLEWTNDQGEKLIFHAKDVALQTEPSEKAVPPQKAQAVNLKVNHCDNTLSGMFVIPKRQVIDTVCPVRTETKAEFIERIGAKVKPLNGCVPGENFETYDLPKFTDGPLGTPYKSGYEDLAQDYADVQYRSVVDDMPPGIAVAIQKPTLGGTYGKIGEPSPLYSQPSEIAPCPFCKSTNVAVTLSGSQWYVECHTCGATGPGVDDGEPDDRATAIRKWGISK